MVMDVAEQSFFAGCADGSIYQVELFRRVSALVLLFQMSCLPGLFKRDVFQVAIHLFSNRSQKTSKCSSNISGTLDLWLVCQVLVITTF